MIVGCMKACTRDEERRIRQALSGTDELLFFDSYEILAQSPVLEEVEVLLGEPPVSLIKRMKGLRWLQMTWAGADKYTCGSDFPRTVTLTNASGAFGRIISEYILAGILTLYRQFPAYRALMMGGGWQMLPGERTLEGKRALILGAGDIGCETARKLSAFDVSSWGVRRVPRACPAYFEAVYTLDQLDALLPEADLVIAALPDTAQTRGLLTEDRLMRMKADALLVNVGRGSLIPLEGLMHVLARGHLGGVLLDVMETEPLAPDHPLRRVDRVMLTPHISGISWGELSETRNRILDIFCENLVNYRQGRPLRNQVNWQSGYRRTVSGT